MLVSSQTQKKYQVHQKVHTSQVNHLDVGQLR